MTPILLHLPMAPAILITRTHLDHPDNGLLSRSTGGRLGGRRLAREKGVYRRHQPPSGPSRSNGQRQCHMERQRQRRGQFLVRRRSREPVAKQGRERWRKIPPIFQKPLDNSEVQLIIKELLNTLARQVTNSGRPSSGWYRVSGRSYFLLENHRVGLLQYSWFTE